MDEKKILESELLKAVTRVRNLEEKVFLLNKELKNIDAKLKQIEESQQKIIMQNVHINNPPKGGK